MQGQQNNHEWLKSLPVVGHDVKIHLKSGQIITYSYARIASDRQVIHLGLIEKASAFDYPMISATAQIPLDRILRISFKDEWGEKRCLDGPAQQAIDQILGSFY